jgi:membrane protease YdiL (CAAX protease family)
MKKAISYLFIFLGIYILLGAIVTMVWEFVTGSTDLVTGKLITTTAVTSVVVIAVFLLTRWAEVSPKWIRTRPWMVLFWSVVASLGALIPSAWVQEQMPELPNIVEQEFDMILQNRWGYLTIGLLAPLSEEIVFRGAILKSLLNSSRLPVWGAIALSALMFSLIHMNPAQMPHAFVIGLLLGWMYWRTGSILPGMAYHWANNSAAYVIYNIYPDSDIILSDIFGSTSRVLMAVGFSLLILLPALYQLNLWMKRAEE